MGAQDLYLEHYLLLVEPVNPQVTDLSTVLFDNLLPRLCPGGTGLFVPHARNTAPYQKSPPPPFFSRRFAFDARELLPVTILNRTYGTHKNLYISLFLLAIFGPYLLWSPVVGTRNAWYGSGPPVVPVEYMVPLIFGLVAQFFTPMY